MVFGCSCLAVFTMYKYSCERCGLLFSHNNDVYKRVTHSKKKTTTSTMAAFLLIDPATENYDPYKVSNFSRDL